MWNCARCRAEVDDGFEVCWQCGTSMDGQADPSFRGAEADTPAQATATEVTAPPQKLVHVAEAVGVERAEVIRRHLEGAAIAVFIADEPAGLLPPTVETVTLQVRETDAERARAIIADIPAVSPPPPSPDLELPEKPAAAPPPPPAGPPGIWEPPNKAELSPQEYIRALEVRLSGLIDDQDVPGWKVNPAFAAEVNTFVQSHANNAPFLKKAQSMQQNKAKYFATIRAQDEQRKKEAEEAARLAAEEAAAAAEAARLAALEPAAPKPPSAAALAWKRRLRRLTRVAAILLVAVFVLGFLGAISYDHMGATELKKATARVDESDKDWEWDDLQKKRAVVKDADNGATVAYKAAEAMPPNWKVDQKYWERFLALPPTVPLTDDEEDDLRLNLDIADDALQLARSMTKYSTGKYPETQISQAVAARLVALLWLDATLRAHDRKRDDAMASCRATLAVGQSVGDDVDQEARRFGIEIAASGIQRVLAQGVAEEEALKETQLLLETEAKQQSSLTALRGLRAFADRTLADGNSPSSIENGRYRIHPRASMPPQDILSATAGRMLLRGNQKENQALALDLLTDAIEIVGLPADQQSGAVGKLEAKIKEKRDNAWPSKRYEAATAIGDYAVRMVQEWRLCQAATRATIVALAAERYRLAHDHWPKSMDELVDSKLLAKEFTVDPLNGQALQWVKEDGGIRIASDRPEYGFRLYDLEYRRQLPLPEKLPLPTPVAQK